MKFPALQPLAGSRQQVSAFLGLDRRLKIPEGAFYETENLTADHYPVLSTRSPRGLYAQVSALALAAADVLEKGADQTQRPGVCLCHIDAADQRLMLGDKATELYLPRLSHKQVVSMGAYLLILPDKMYINTVDPTDYGSIDATWKGQVALTSCNAQGEATETATCTKLSALGIGKDFRADDCVALSGLEDLTGVVRIRKSTADEVIIDGVTAGSVAELTLSRQMPEMDFVVECSNRLWGCRYGKDKNGKVINELYCSRLGDFRNWRSYQGLATDSWAASVGSDGPFTGAATYLGQPIFFKEACLHKVYVSPIGAHQVVDTPCQGVQLHCGRTVTVVGETLYYKSRTDVMAYNGAIPRPVGQALGDYRFAKPSITGVPDANGQYIEAVGGAAGSKYYLCLNDPQGLRQLLVYDTERGLWHKEDSPRLLHMCALGPALYASTDDGRVLCLTGGEGEQTIAWQATTGDMGLDSPDSKYISKLCLRMALSPGGAATVFLQYDHSGVWEQVASFRGDRLGSFSVSLRPRRCDHLRLRLVGTGAMKLYSLTKTVRGGSDKV